MTYRNASHQASAITTTLHRPTTGTALIPRNKGKNKKASYIPTPTLHLHTSLTNFLLTIVAYVSITDIMFTEILDLLTPELMEGRRDVKEVLERRNRDAVWFVLWRERARVVGAERDGDGAEDGEGHEDRLRERGDEHEDRANWNTDSGSDGDRGRDRHWNRNRNRNRRNREEMNRWGFIHIY